MSGKRFILDTNAIVSLLKGNEFLVDSVPKTKRFTNRYWFEELGIFLDVESLKI